MKKLTILLFSSLVLCLANTPASALFYLYSLEGKVRDFQYTNPPGQSGNPFGVSKGDRASGFVILDSADASWSSDGTYISLPNGLHELRADVGPLSLFDKNYQILLNKDGLVSYHADGRYTLNGQPPAAIQPEMEFKLTPPGQIYPSTSWLTNLNSFSGSWNFMSDNGGHIPYEEGLPTFTIGIDFTKVERKPYPTQPEAPVPEPASIALTASGLALLGGRRTWKCRQLLRWSFQRRTI